jgi:hypothetical protein
VAFLPLYSCLIVAFRLLLLALSFLSNNILNLIWNKPCNCIIVIYIKLFFMKYLKRFWLLTLMALMTTTAANAQTRKERKAARIEEVKSIVEAQNFVFDANYMNPTRLSGRALNSQYDLTVTKDSIISYLPYFGVATVAPTYGSQEGGIKFTTTKFTYVSKPGKKSGWSITIKPTVKNISDSRDVQSMYLTISEDGYASLQVTSTNRDPISFNGTIEKIPAKK